MAPMIAIAPIETVKEAVTKALTKVNFSDIINMMIMIEYGKTGFATRS